MTGTLHDNDGMIFAILRDNAGKYWMYGMKAGSFSALSQDKDSYFQIEAPDIEKATAFAHPSDLVLFILCGRKSDTPIGYDFQKTPGTSDYFPGRKTQNRVIRRKNYDDQIQYVYFG